MVGLKYVAGPLTVGIQAEKAIKSLLNQPQRPSTSIRSQRLTAAGSLI